MGFKHRSLSAAAALISLIAIDNVGPLAAQAGPQNAVVVGVIGTGVTPATVAKGQVLPLGTTITAAPGTRVFLSEEWNTATGRCIYWTIVNGASWSVVAPSRTEPCPVINPNLSLTAAATRAGITIISNVHRHEPQPEPTVGTGPVGTSAQAIKTPPLDARLSNELEALMRRQPATPAAQKGPRTERPVVVTPPVTSASACEQAVQGKIAWDYSGNTAWDPRNVQRLCQGARNDQPARCFNRVMHGGINWGNGTQWRWENAIDLCERAADADATVACFQSRVKDGRSWPDAVHECKSLTKRE